MSFRVVVGLVVGAICLAPACSKKPEVTVVAPQPVLIAKNRNEPVIFNDEKFFVTFDYRSNEQAYDVAVRRASRPLRKRPADLEDAARVASSTLTHYACYGSTKAKTVGTEGTLNGRGTWTGRLRCT